MANDILIAVLPKRLIVLTTTRQPFVLKTFWMDLGYQNLFIIGSVEDANVPARWQSAVYPPKKVVI